MRLFAKRLLAAVFRACRITIWRRITTASTAITIGTAFRIFETIVEAIGIPCADCHTGIALGNQIISLITSDALTINGQGKAAGRLRKDFGTGLCDRSLLVLFSHSPHRLSHPLVLLDESRFFSQNSGRV